MSVAEQGSRERAFDKIRTSCAVNKDRTLHGYEECVKGGILLEILPWVISERHSKHNVING